MSYYLIRERDTHRLLAYDSDTDEFVLTADEAIIKADYIAIKQLLAYAQPRLSSAELEIVGFVTEVAQ